jgi:predicted transcriptional regulator
MPANMMRAETTAGRAPGSTSESASVTGGAVGVVSTTVTVTVTSGVVVEET